MRQRETRRKPYSETFRIPTLAEAKQQWPETRSVLTDTWRGMLRAKDCEWIEVDGFPAIRSRTYKGAILYFYRRGYGPFEAVFGSMAAPDELF